MELAVKNRRRTLIYKIDEGGLFITEVHKNGFTSDVHIPFENIRREKMFYHHTRPQYLIAAGIFFIISTISTLENLKSPNFPWLAVSLWTIIFLIFIIAFFLHRENNYYLKTFRGSFIKFKVDGNTAEISSFVENIITTRNKFLKLKYGSPNNFISYDSQYSNFNILLREGVISEDEYKVNIEKLSETFKQHAPGKTSNQFSQN